MFESLCSTTPEAHAAPTSSSPDTAPVTSPRTPHSRRDRQFCLHRTGATRTRLPGPALPLRPCPLLASREAPSLHCPSSPGPEGHQARSSLLGDLMQLGPQMAPTQIKYTDDSLTVSPAQATAQSPRPPFPPPPAAFSASSIGHSILPGAQAKNSEVSLDLSLPLTLPTSATRKPGQSHLGNPRRWAHSHRCGLQSGPS